MAREGPYRSIETYGEWSHCGWEPQPSLVTRFSTWLSGAASDPGEYYTWGVYQLV